MAGTAFRVVSAAARMSRMPPIEEVVPESMRGAGVTRRELEIFWLVADRLHNREIAERLHLSERTVESHVSSLIGKLLVPGRRGLVEAGATLREMRGRRPLRRPLSSFVGRTKELDDLRRLISAHRLVTLVGPAGTGKTRLALRLAELADTPPPAVLVDLATASPGAEVDRLFADALGVVAGGEGLRDVLRDTLAHGRHWLIVDNCEHVADPTAALLADLLGSSEQLTVLATSNGQLHVPGEVVYPVQPLPLPTASDEPSIVLDSASARLFADRATAADPGFSVGPTNARDVADLCRRLDGLPLAIELAAARARAFSPAELLARLDDRFTLLADEGQGSGSRHVSLEAALRWSYDLLEDDERVLFDRCGVFPGAFDYDTAAAIMAYPPLRRSDLARLFPRLLDRSLLSASRSGELTEYRLLDSVRQFATQRLAERTGGEHAVEAHARYHLRRAPSLVADLQGRDQPGAMSWFERRWVDLRAAMSWALERGDTDEAWAFVAGVGTGWEIVGMRDELFDWIDALLEAPLPTGSLGVRATITAALLLSMYRDAPRATEIVKRGLKQDAVGDPWDLALTRFAIGATMPRGASTAASLLVAAAEEFRLLGDDWHRAIALRSLGEATGDVEGVLRCLDEAADVFGQLHDLVSRANCRHLMGARCLDAGVRLEDADRWLREAKELAAAAGSRHEWLHAELFSALLEQRRGDPARSRARFDALVPEFRRIGDRRCVGRSLLGLGVAAAAAGEQEAAQLHLRACVQTLHSVGPTLALAAALRLLAGFHRSAGDARHAAVLLGAADAVVEQLESASHDSLPPDGRLRAGLEQDLGSGELIARLAEGRRTPVGELLGAFS